MIRTLLTLLLLASGSTVLLCQVPGYLGKRLTLQGEFHSFPALEGPTADKRGLDTNTGDEGGQLGLNWSAGARLGYVTSRFGQTVLSFDYLKTGMNQVAYGPPINSGYSSYELFYHLTGLTIGIGTRKFISSKGGLAPMGLYRGYSLSATFLKGKLVEKYTPSNIPLILLDTTPKHTVLSLGYNVGSNFIVKDRFLLNLGVKFNLALSPRALRYVFVEEGLWDPSSNEQGFSTFDEGNTYSFKTLAAARYALHSVFMIYFGVGLIP